MRRGRGTKLKTELRGDPAGRLLFREFRDVYQQSGFAHVNESQSG